jgi:hypothetical protein
MSDGFRIGRRLRAAIAVRDAAIAILQTKGERDQANHEHLVFQPHTPENPYPAISLLLSKHPLDQRFMLSVWANLKGDKYGKVLNIEWLGDRIDLVNFRRGEWESELLVLGKTGAVAVH